MPKSAMGLLLDKEQKEELKQYLKQKFRKYKNVARTIQEISGGRGKTVTGNPINAQYIAFIFSEGQRAQRSLSPETAQALYLACDKDDKFEYLNKYAESRGTGDYFPSTNPETRMANIRFEKSMEILPILYKNSGDKIRQEIARGLERLIQNAESIREENSD